MDRVHYRLIVLAAGRGTRFKQEGYSEPKPFIDVCGLKMTDLVIRNMRSQLGMQIPTTVILHQDFGRLPFDSPDTEVIKLPDHNGAAIAANFELNRGNADEKIIICNCDQLVLFNGKKFLGALDDHSGAILTFEEPTLNPKWSYAELDDKGDIVRVAEKIPISTHATVGVYAYASKRIASEAIRKMKEADDKFNNEFYLCPAYNYIDGSVANVKVKKMWGLGTPEDLNSALTNKKFLAEIDKIK